MEHGMIANEIGVRRSRNLLIGGELRPASSNHTFPCIDPTTGEVLTEVPEASIEDVDAAVAAARSAFDRSDWARNPRRRRAALLKLADLVAAHAEELATLETLDVGGLHSFTRHFAARATVRNFEYFASWIDKVYGEVTPAVSSAKFSYTLREPLGVVAAIYAWNSPLTFLGAKIGPALAAGNTIIMKPSELGSLTALRFAELCVDADVPAGVINFVTGGGAVGARLVEHPDVDKISFTGGTATGKRIMATAANTLKKVHLELGGKSPNIVFADAPLDKAVKGVIGACFNMSGQMCIAGSRLFVEESIHDDFVRKVVDATGQIRIGDPLDTSTVLGPLISQAQLDRAERFLASGQSSGARLLIGGDRPRNVPPGYFLAPSIFGDVDPASEIAREEIFAPVLSVFRFRDESDAVAQANDTVYGLAAGVWTSNVGRAHRVARDLRAGNVWVNDYGVLTYNVPFGGYKQSGMGREGGREAIEEYTQVKNVSVEIGS